MNWKIYDKDGELVNTIYADEAFTKQYCEVYGYTYEAEERPEPVPVPAPEPTAEDITLDLLADHEERICMLELTGGV